MDSMELGILMRIWLGFEGWAVGRLGSEVLRDLGKVSVGLVFSWLGVLDRNYQGYFNDFITCLDLYYK